MIRIGFDQLVISFTKPQKQKVIVIQTSNYLQGN